MTRLVGTSWKMNLTSSDAVRWFEAAVPALGPAAGGVGCEVFVLPPYTSLWVARELLAGTRVAWGAQDVHPDEAGAHTGDVSAAMLADLGCRYVEVGHSERRRDHGETDAVIARKVERVVAHGMTPVLCVGEPARGATAAAIAFVLDQLEADLARLDPSGWADIVVAYEPVWAIGEGAAAAPPDHVGRVHAAIQDRVRDRSGRRGRVLYGGSVDEASTAAIVDRPDVDGLFVGRAALDPARFAAIVATVAATRGGT